MNKKNNGNDTSLPYGERLVAYTAYITKMANFYCGKHPANGPADDFMQDVFLLGMQRQKNYDPKYTFGTWVRYLCRIIADRQKKRRQTAAGAARHVELDADRFESCAPRQFEYAELSQVLRLLSGRDGEVVLRTAMGDELHEIGADLGVSKERVRQLKVRARQRLVEAGFAEAA